MRTFLIIAFSFIIGKSYSQEKTTVENIEGIYTKSWEYSNFMELEVQNCLLVAEHWTEFAPNVKYKGKPFDFSQIKDLEGVYMKVNAEVFTGKSCGHLGSWKSKIVITEILEINTTQNLNSLLKVCGSIKRKVRT